MNRATSLSRKAAPWGFRRRRGPRRKGSRGEWYLEPITGMRTRLLKTGQNVLVGPNGVVELDSRDGIEFLRVSP